MTPNAASYCSAISLTKPFRCRGEEGLSFAWQPVGFNTIGLPTINSPHIEAARKLICHLLRYQALGASRILPGQRFAREEVRVFPACSHCKAWTGADVNSCNLLFSCAPPGTACLPCAGDGVSKACLRHFHAPYVGRWSVCEVAWGCRWRCPDSWAGEDGCFETDRLKKYLPLLLTN